MLSLSLPKIASVGCGLLALAMVVSSRAVSQEIDSANRPKPPDGDRKVYVHKDRTSPIASNVAITAVRNLNNEHWLRDLEVEVKNNFSKPIYYLQVLLSMPELTMTDIDGIPHGIVNILTYGRREMWKLSEMATAEDIPIKPGQTAILKVPESDWKGTEAFMASKGIPPTTIKTVMLRVYTINFGDGTGVTIDTYKDLRGRYRNNLSQNKRK